uniref:Iron ABC transporter permease n=1 Tax=Roseihalotalea indica TaxID=2867963 RepID=A0AA49JFW3_9BACT|nr:iron ABC transporter permease [Tunicatimonas sp. TK19036]
MPTMAKTTSSHHMRRKESLSPSVWLVLLGLGVIIAGVADIAWGSVPIPLGEVFQLLIGGKSDSEIWSNILFKIRLPKACTALLAGIALSVSGLQLQTLFRNPLAGPSVLGITAGASLGVAAVMLASGQSATLYAIQQSGVGQGWLLVCAASAGAALVLLLILAVSLRINDNIVLLIIGIMFSNITLSVVSIWQYFSQPEQIRDYLLWTLGSLGSVTTEHLGILFPLTFLGVLGAFLLSKNLNGLLLGEQYARSMGLPILTTRIGIILVTSILVGLITGFCGPIGFVGIAVPHLVRSLFHTTDHRWLIPGCCLMGALVLLLCDLISQWPGSAWVLPINAITALLGSPVVIWVIIRRRNLQSHFH